MGRQFFKLFGSRDGFFQKLFDNALFKNRGKDNRLQRLTDDDCHCRKQLLQAFNKEGCGKWV